MSDKDFQYYHYYLTFFFYICKKNNNNLYQKQQQEGIREQKIKNKKLYIRKKICVYEKKKFVYNPSIFTEIIQLYLCLSLNVVYSQSFITNNGNIQIKFLWGKEKVIQAKNLVLYLYVKITI